jgi:hypothetical protein
VLVVRSLPSSLVWVCFTTSPDPSLMQTSLTCAAVFALF